MPQQQEIYDNFTGEEFLWYMAALKGLEKKYAKNKIDNLLKVVNLTSEKNKKIGSYSGGMKQRILIAQALLNDPDILIMDEPTAGLDPSERIRIRNFLSEMSENKIIIIATHIVSDIEFIAKEILEKGGCYYLNIFLVYLHIIHLSWKEIDYKLVWQLQQSLFKQE